jgi:transposase-like protein
MSKPNPHGDEVKATAMAALLHGQSVSSVARDYHLPKQTVWSWKQQAIRDADGVDAYATQKDRIGDLLVRGLEEEIRATQEIAIAVQNPEWLEKQSASELGVLYGILTDKTIRKLEALSAGNEE